MSDSTTDASALQKEKKNPVKILKKKCFRTGPVFLGGVCTCKINISFSGYIAGLKIIPF